MFALIALSRIAGPRGPTALGDFVRRTGDSAMSIEDLRHELGRAEIREELPAELGAGFDSQRRHPRGLHSLVAEPDEPLPYGPAHKRAGIVVLIPGIMASAINQRSSVGNDTCIWLCAGTVFTSRMNALALDKTGINPAPNVGNECYASSVMTGILFWDFYGRTASALSDRDLDVRLQPYDWRLPVRTQVVRVRAKLRELAARTEHLSLVCHSMGGLVGLLAAFGDDSDIADKIERLVIGGTPFLGSFDSINVFLAKEDVIREVALWRDERAERIAEVCATFPGVHDLMPTLTLGSGADRARDPSCYVRKFGDADRRLAPDLTFLEKSDATRADVLRALDNARAHLSARGPLKNRLLILSGTGVTTPWGFTFQAPNVPTVLTGNDRSDGDDTVLRRSARAGGDQDDRRSQADVTVDVLGVHHRAIFADDSVATATADLISYGSPPKHALGRLKIESLLPEQEAESAAELRRLIEKAEARAEVTPSLRLQIAIGRAIAALLTHDPSAAKRATAALLAELERN